MFDMCFDTEIMHAVNVWRKVRKVKRGFAVKRKGYEAMWPPIGLSPAFSHLGEVPPAVLLFGQLEMQIGHLSCHSLVARTSYRTHVSDLVSVCLGAPGRGIRRTLR